MTSGVLRRFLLLAGIAILTAFHALLLWRRISDGSIADPAVLARWIASAVLVLSLLKLRRWALRHFGSGRSAAVLVLLVVLVHAPVGDRMVDVAELAALGQVLAASLAALALRTIFDGISVSAPGFVRSEGVATLHHYARPDAPRSPPRF